MIPLKNTEYLELYEPFGISEDVCLSIYLTILYKITPLIKTMKIDKVISWFYSCYLVNKALGRVRPNYHVQGKEIIKKAKGFKASSPRWKLHLHV